MRASGGLDQRGDKSAPAAGKESLPSSSLSRYRRRRSSKVEARGRIERDESSGRVSIRLVYDR